MRAIVTGVMCIFFCLIGYSQKTQYQQDSIKAIQDLVKFTRAYYQKPDSIAYFMELNLKNFKKLYEICIHDSLDAANYAEALFQKGYYYFWRRINEDTSKLFLEKSLALCKEYFGEYHVTASMAMNKLAYIHLRHGEYDKAGDLFYKSLTIRENILDSLNMLLALGYGNWAYYNELIGQYHTAKIYEQKAADIGEKHYEIFKQKNKDGYNRLVMLSGYSPEIIPEDLKHLIIRDAPFNYAGGIADACFEALKNNDILKAKVYFNKLLSVERDFPSPFVQDHIQRLRMLFEVIEQPLSERVNAYVNHLVNEEPVFGQSRPEASWRSVGLKLYEAGQLEQAARLFEKACTYFSDNQGKSTYIGAYQSIFYLAKTYNRLGKFHQSDSLTIYFIKKLLGEQNFALLSEGKPTIGAPLALIQRSLFILAVRAEMYLLRYNSTYNSEDLEVAVRLHQAFNSQIQTLRHQLDWVDDRAELLNQGYWIYENAIEAALLLYQINHERNLIESAMQWSAICKQVVAKSLGSKDENDLRRDTMEKNLLVLSRKINALELKLKDYRTVKNTENDEFTENVTNLIIKYRKDYDYLKVKRLNKSNSLNSNQQLTWTEVNFHELSDMVKKRNTSYIDYFFGSRNLYSFTVTPDTLIYHIRPISDDFLARINSFLYELQTKPGVKDLMAVENYQNEAYDLFISLLKWTWPLIKTRSLYISTDGPLVYLPFESLCFSKKYDPTDFRKLDYIIREKDIFYGYGVHDILSKKSTKPLLNRIKYVGFAPRFRGELSFKSSKPEGEVNNLYLNMYRSSLMPLKYNSDEVIEASHLFASSEFYLSDLDIEKITSKIKGKDIVHFATHALVNDKNPDYSQLLISDSVDEVIYQPLFAYKLSTMPIDADLVILSACNTRLGELKRGEGLISLAQAVKTAGAKNIVSSLWGVNDFSSKHIVVRFLKGIKEGEIMADALNKSKLSYIEAVENPILAHPHYWAAMILQGDNYNILSYNYFKYLIMSSILGIFLIVGSKLYLRKN